MPAQSPAPFGAIRLCPVPDLAPPYDDDTPDEPIPPGPSPLPASQGSAPLPASQRGASQSAPAASGTSTAGGTIRPSQFAQVLAETLAGARPPAQLTPWTTERARSRIRRLGPMLTANQQPRVHRVVTSQPAPGVVEMSVVVGFGGAVRALAVRLERTQAQASRPGRPAQQARWLCTALEVA
jgi:hypothetical protein